MQRVLFLLFLVVILARPTGQLYSQLPSFANRGYNNHFPALKSAYYSSQYVQKKNPGIIPDGTLESFAGGIFLKGLNPILIVHDQPPMGRYIISLSILLFDNASTLPAILLLFAVFGIFLIGRLALGNSFAALVPAGIFINEPLFLQKFQYLPLLEPIQLPFIVFALYFFIRGILSKKYIRWFVLTSIMLGFVISIRYFVLGTGLLAAMVLYFMIDRSDKKKITSFFITLPLALVVLFASYFRTIMLGSSLFNIFGIQKYIFVYHKSAFILPFSFWDLVMFNRWHTWWGEYKIASDNQWLITWPISLVCFFCFLVGMLFKKIKANRAEKVILLWIIVQCIMLSAGYTSTRYFLPLVPFVYIIAASFVCRIYKLYFVKRK